MAIETNQFIPQGAQKNNSFKRLSLAKVGLFELGFVLVLIVLIFGLLNYLNILSLNKVFPSLSFLPHINQLSKIPVPTIYSYNNPKVATTMNFFTKQVLKSRYQPTYLKINTIIAIKDQQEFVLHWIVKDSSSSSEFTSKVNYQPATNKIESSTLSISLKNDPTVPNTVTIATADALTSIFFQVSHPSWNCQPIPFSCEYFSSTPEGKIGYGIVGDTRSKLPLLIYSCFIPKESSLYAKSASCLSGDLAY